VRFLARDIRIRHELSPFKPRWERFWDDLHVHEKGLAWLKQNSDPQQPKARLVDYLRDLLEDHDRYPANSTIKQHADHLLEIFDGR